MKRIGIFVDVSNLYYCIAKKFRNRKLDYKAYLEFVKPLGEIIHAVAYGAQRGHEARDFIARLHDLGFETKFKTPKEYHNASGLKCKADWDVGIAVDIISRLDKMDLIILGSADGDMLPLVEYAQARGVKVVVIGCGISSDLRQNATQSIEITESMLEEKRHADKNQDGARV